MRNVRDETRLVAFGIAVRNLPSVSNIDPPSPAGVAPIKEDIVANENLKTLVSQGLSAMRAGSDVAAKATDEIGNDASYPELKSSLDRGNQTSKQWADRIDRALQQAGDGQQGDNPVVEAHYEVSRRIRQQAADETSRDLGIIANGQLALHYWIASFGTMANYTKALGMDDVARDMKSSADEAKQADEQYTQLAEKLLSQG